MDKVNATREWGAREHKKAENDLQKRLSKKATDRQHGIKYQSNLYGDQNYTVTKLQRDIGGGSSTDQLLESEIELCKQSLREQYRAIPSI